MAQLAAARKEGGWVLLQNIHLTIDWTSGPLEKAVDKLAEGSHPDFRSFLLCIYTSSQSMHAATDRSNYHAASCDHAAIGVLAVALARSGRVAPRQQRTADLVLPGSHACDTAARFGKSELACAPYQAVPVGGAAAAAGARAAHLAAPELHQAHQRAA